jgi:branched-subunit amino acid aminotransferase/4-amino-4-deoxychorismate lyase
MAAVLVGADGELAEPRDVPPTAQALLASLASAASSGGGDGANAAPSAPPPPNYTTALAVWSGDGGYEVVDWHLHVERLERDARDGSLPAVATRRAARALAALAAAASPPPRAAMLVVAAVAGQSQPSVLAYAKAAPPYAAALEPPLTPPAALRVVAALGSGGRREAGAKRCAWVSQRAPLEAWAAASGRYDEVLLVDGDDDAVLEGLVSNFYAIVEKEEEEEEKGGGKGGGGGGGGGRGGDPTPDLASLVLETAVDPNALPGVVQRRVLEAAARLGLAVRAPAAAGGGGPSLAALRAGRWREALASSCLRGLAPVAGVCVRRYRPGRRGGDGGGGDGGAGATSWDATLPPAGPVGRLLMDEVRALQRCARLLVSAKEEEEEERAGGGGGGGGGG